MECKEHRGLSPSLHIEKPNEDESSLGLFIDYFQKSSKIVIGK